ncbi:hypothetical protein MADA3029_740099 [Vibrio nigripulchritudo MADA3029]|uniref:GNAT family N-acetyltransferase n=1 Tax=Vibrio nigripulchritudo TaxID=28173 RepID=UPI0003B2105F|nr:GNAT family N-acetyltransferase [Vibrio nigripulchritudo]CCN49193.1 hypothetical protein VIBNIMADA3020_710032 [Vibrio nigripulchritudo MADA3020]CCN54178.1 hypothetical protein VIBNIMADA3021_510101 [Vibrio nigripulchritudo MADA3021]CCN61248.1 hypothetical protein MADA3029_740099 [Vibrio nigripulchritudo MADA3029]
MIEELTTTFTENDYEAAEKVISEYLVQTGFEGNVEEQVVENLAFLCKENILRNCDFYTHSVFMDGRFIGGFVLKEYDDAFKINYIVVTGKYQNQGLGTIMARQVRHIESMTGKPSFVLVNRNEAADVSNFYNSVGYGLVFDNVDGGGDSLFMCDEKSLSRIEDNQNAENAMVYPNTVSNIKAAHLLAA